MNVHSTAASRGTARWSLAALGATVLALLLAVGVSQEALGDRTFTVKNTKDSGKGSLRAAIQKANNAAGSDLVRFDIPGGGVKTIRPESPLPAITETLAVDGYTQDGTSRNTGDGATILIQLSGNKAPNNANGLSLGSAADGSRVSGLAVNRFKGHGILVSGDENTIDGNHIGTNAAGSSDGGNRKNGVLVSGSDNTIGGSDLGARNVISGNGLNGVEIDGAGATGNRVRANQIGSSVDGTAQIPNDADGVLLDDSASGNTIGGLGQFELNAIRFNGEDGISVQDDAQGNSFVRNVVVGNGGLGIDLQGGTENSFGVTANDTDDGDGGENNLQNFPVITSAARSGTTNLTTISGTLNSVPSQEFEVDCYAAAPDASGHGETLFPVARDETVTTNSGGDATFQCVSGALGPGQPVTVTATRESTGDTSEFSPNVVVVAVS